MLFHYWCFKDVGFKFEPYVCNKCHDVLMTTYELKNIAVLNAKGVDFRCILWGISRDEAVNRLNILYQKVRVFYKWILVQIKRRLKRLKKAHLEEHILETFILVLMESSVESHGEIRLVCKNLFLFMLIFLGWKLWNAFLREQLL